jgi:hypothetical protein
MNKVIFLDIDGVLNSQKWHSSEAHIKIHKCMIRRGDLDELSYEIFNASMIDPEALQLLNQLVEETGADIVISSTWRKGEGERLNNIKSLLHGLGFKGNIIGATPVLNERWCCRGNEIKKWILENVKYEDMKDFKYAILDDDSDMLLEQKNSFYYIDNKIGLSTSLVSDICVFWKK